MIVCRNVMIYFDKTLQDRVHGLFYESLDTFGVLALGRQGIGRRSRRSNESYEDVDAAERIYRKIA